MSSSLSLVVLAAGMGARYGGLKQLDPVGPSEETILDYAVFDAIRAGFTRVVFVIRRDFEAEFKAQVGSRYAGKIDVDYVFQSLDRLPAGFAVPAGRVKPWGTGHAVWCARGAVDGPFAVIGADDFFGRDALVQLSDFLRPPVVHAEAAPAFAMVGYRLANTLSENGAVSRGVCAVDGRGFLTEVVEHSGIRPEEVGAGKKYSGEEVVSMNCWGFTPALFTALDEQFAAFLEERGGEATAEFYLPAAVSEQVATGLVTVEVRPTTASWFGVTYREDRPRVRAALAALVAAGEYPAGLF